MNFKILKLGDLPDVLLFRKSGTADPTVVIQTIGRIDDPALFEDENSEDSFTEEVVFDYTSSAKDFINQYDVESAKRWIKALGLKK